MKRIQSIAILCILLVTTFGMPTMTMAMEPSEHSIYDVLVDRYNNAVKENDQDVDLQNPNAYFGGDFIGVKERLHHIEEMKFTMISLGNVWEASNYVGDETTSYVEVNEHFGTAEELTSLVEFIHEKEMSVIVDVPLNCLGEMHPLRQTFETSNDECAMWVNLDQTLIDEVAGQLVESLQRYAFDGFRLTNLEGWDETSLNTLMEQVRTAVPSVLFVAGEDTEAAVDLQHNTSLMTSLHDTFKQFNGATEAYVQAETLPRNTLVQVDELFGQRMTYEMVELRMFPPTRWKTALTALFTLPGVPVVSYGTEIAMNGETVAESHQGMNFKTEMELKDLIGDLNTLRNTSNTFRNGEYELLHNEDHFTIYARYSEDEHWIIAINNSDETKAFGIPKERFMPESTSEKMKMRGVLNQDLVRLTKDEQFNIVLDREQVEVYYVEEDKGYNVPYLIASIIVYVAFLLFIYLVLKNSKKNRAA